MLANLCKIRMLVACQFCIHCHRDFLGNFLVNDLGYRDVVVRQRNGKGGLNPEFVSAQFQLAFYDALLLHAMYIEIAFGANGVYPVLLKVYLFDNFSGKTCLRIFPAFHVVFIEMLSLERAVEALERLYFHRPCEGLFGSVYDTPQLAALGRDALQRCIGLESDLSVFTSKHALLGAIFSMAHKAHLRSQRRYG